MNGTVEPGGFSDTDVFPGNYTTEGEFSRTVHEGPYDAKESELVRLESPIDGAAAASLPS